MKSQRRDTSEDCLTISRPNSRSATSPNARGNSETTTMAAIPIDLLFEILLRLPAKSIAKCRCLSKLCESILLRPYFTDPFMTMSISRPRLLFSFPKKSELHFFSSPQIRNPGEISNSSFVSADYHMKFRFDDSYDIPGPVHGLVCLTDLNEKEETFPVICNPSTGKSSPLPIPKTRRDDQVSGRISSFLGFDPIGKQYKVLSISQWTPVEHQVMTLGNERSSWRRIECGVSYRYLEYDGICIDGICIDGVVYYVAAVNNPEGVGVNSIVCFDVRCERFRFVNRAEGMGLWSDSTLVNYKGKLGVLVYDGIGINGLTGESRYLELWVLVDAERHEWSKNVYEFPQPLWNNVVVAEAKSLFFVGIIAGTDEVVLSKPFLCDPFYVYYFNIERNSVRRVEIGGMDAFKNYRVKISLDHVEDVKLMANV